MKIKILLGESDRTALVVDASHGAGVAMLLANATVYEAQGYGSTQTWKISEKPATLAYVDGTEFAPNERVAAAEKRADERSSDWLRELNLRQRLEAQVAELNAKIEGLTFAASEKRADDVVDAEMPR